MKTETMARRLRQCEADLKDLKYQLEQLAELHSKLCQVVSILDRSVSP